MPNPDFERFRGIKTFRSLVKYLRDDLDWPIETEDFDELTYDYEAEELGIDVKNAAKIDYIKQLKPLHSKQPWGIFFVKFEPKKLPVVALRRILGQLVIKKRASANQADQQTWKLSDLLFLSNYGENEQRQITFAHFSGNDDSKNLPTLKVLGWDDSDTALHIDHAHTTLRDKLCWPDNEGRNLDAWRRNWSSAFTLRHREVIETSKELAERLAGLAQQIRKRANSILSIETEGGPLRKVMAGFKEALIHDLTEDSFSDMYAQTITYGLLSARITNPKGDSPDELSKQMSITNPFLKELMESFLSVGGRKGKSGTGVGIDFDELGINEVVDLLTHSNMEAVVRDFGDKNPLEDPVIHFYELFLKEYDQDQKVKRGVFYTPRPVVYFIVKSIDEMLRNEFGLRDGLADTTNWGEMVKRNKDLKIPQGVKQDDPFIQILDPATGTGTFLVEVIDLIHNTMVEKWRKNNTSKKNVAILWNTYVANQLLPRLHGYELLMAPYAIAHMKIGIKLFETGYRFESKDRVRIYLTNALEPAHDMSDRFEFAIPALAHEAKIAQKSKNKLLPTVILGNPPYANYGQLNRNDWILDLLEEYKKGLNEKKLNLDDDYIKFIRYCHWRLEKSPKAILSIISNNSFLSGVTHRQMRKSLLNTFGSIKINDLHGSIRLKEKTPAGLLDKNVFDIQQGVAISTMKRDVIANEKTSILHMDIWGERASKYKKLLNSEVSYNQLINENWNSNLCFFMPNDTKHSDEYDKFPILTELFSEIGQGIQTKRDKVAIQISKAKMKKVISNFKKMSPEEISHEYSIPLETPSWSIARAIEDIESSTGKIIPLLNRPFDYRFTFYTGKTNGFLARPRKKSTDNMLDGNLAIVAKRQTKEKVFSSAWVVNIPINEGFFSIDPKGRETLFPLTNLKKQTQPNLFAQQEENKNLNLKPPKSTSKAFHSADLFFYIYAILNSQLYGSKYIHGLKIDFPRIPMTENLQLFQKLSIFGKALVFIHTGSSTLDEKQIKSHLPAIDFSIGNFCGPTKDSIPNDSPKYEKKCIHINSNSYFENIPENIWELRIGGYQVCQKWIKDRRGEICSPELIKEYQKMVRSLKQTLELRAEIDKLILEYGGFSKAFNDQD